MLTRDEILDSLKSYLEQVTKNVEQLKHYPSNSNDPNYQFLCGMEIAYRNAISLFYAEKVK
jgi:primosomal protein N''